MASEVSTLLASRASAAGLTLTDPVAEQLATYYELLQRWNRKINLTSLVNPDEAIDRLLLEPVAAAALLPHSARLIDLGSGGGSPAIPLALAGSASLLVMAESRSRKAAFLREAVRELGLSAIVENARFETLGSRQEYQQQMEVVSIRAVKLDPAGLRDAARFLVADGRMALFENSSAPALTLPGGLEVSGTFPLLSGSRLTLLCKV